MTDILGPNEMGGIKRPRLNDDMQKIDIEVHQMKKKKDDFQKREDDMKSNKKHSKKSKGKKVESQESGELALVEDENIAEMTLGQKLELLSKKMNEEEQIHEKDIQQVEAHIMRRMPTADSLVTLLEQALQSNDSALLEQCLLCTNLDIIDVTTQRLPTHRVLALLKTLVSKFEKRPSRGVLVTHWLSYILKHHLSFLITVPDLSRQLAGLSQLLEQRLSSYSRLAALSGRLDLLITEVSSQKSSNGVIDAAKRPLVEYQDE